jgi:hypothetical protein
MSDAKVSATVEEAAVAVSQPDKGGAFSCPRIYERA